MISPPPNQQAIQDENGKINPAWQDFCTDVFMGIQTLESSGTTAKRPTKNLYPGRFYFDTSLGANGKPIWINKLGTGWILADGTAA